MALEQQMKIIEERFADRGLLFTSPFEVDTLVEAYGCLDGMRFYFRRINGRASLRVGRYDRELEEGKAQKRVKRLAELSIVETLKRIPDEDDAKLFPNVILRESYFESTGISISSIFTTLVNTLKPIR